MDIGLIKVAAATPKVRVADCTFNGLEIINNIKEASQNGTSIIVFPELAITGYTCSDLFLQQALLNSAEQEIEYICAATENLNIISVVGAPVLVNSKLYNCGVVIYNGTILAVVPKTNIPNYNEFYEARHFTSGSSIENETIMYCNQNVMVSNNVVFKSTEDRNFTFGIEICEDLWVSNPPSIPLAEGGANIILNLSASNEIIGKSEYRKALVKMQSSKLVCAYVYADCGFGESTTDVVFSGHNIISENGKILGESKLFSNGITYADVDLQVLESERRRITTFKNTHSSANTVYFDMPSNKFEISRKYSQTPFVPTSKADIDTRCSEILSIQAAGLATRLYNTGIKNVVIGLSGGLDSTLALIVAVHAFDMLKIDRKNILAVTMPCFGTTKRTKSNAECLAEAYGVDFKDIDITNAVLQHFSDIDHNKNMLNITYENSQARERTQILMDLANKTGGLVIGTGDLSELALGWATYNGDHMSMYAVNASIPKTLVRYLTAYEASISEDNLKTILTDIYNTPVSPELLPPVDGQISQKTEDIVGPYELHDFFLFYMLRYGFAPSKIFFICKIAFADKYSNEEIIKWFTTFTKRFFMQQFKRSCLPDGPKVGTIAVSPRGDLRMPSDASAKIWLKDIENLQKLLSNN